MWPHPATHFHTLTLSSYRVLASNWTNGKVFKILTWLLHRPYYVKNKSECTDLTACSRKMWFFWIIRARKTQFGGSATGRKIEELWFNSQGGKKFLSSPKNPDWHCGPPSLLSNADQGQFLLCVKQLGHLVLKLRTSGAIPPLPICTDAVNRHNFTLIDWCNANV